MNPGHQLGRRFLPTTKVSNGMLVARLLQRLVSKPTVGVDHASRFHRILDEGNQTPGRGIGNSPQADASDTASLFLSRNYNQGFLFGFATSHAFLQPAQKGFIDFHGPSQPFTARPDHRPAQFMQPSPGRLVAPQAQYALQPQSTDAVLLRRYPPHRPKPKGERGVGILEDRSGRHRHFAAAIRTAPPHRTERPRLGPTAARTAKPVRPPKLKQVGPARLLRSEPRLQLRQGSRVILHRWKYYRLGLGESSGYPEHADLSGSAIRTSGKVHAREHSRPKTSELNPSLGEERPAGLHARRQQIRPGQVGPRILRAS